MPVALVTGVNGFCGRHLVRRLRKERSLRIVGTGRAAPLPGDSAPDDFVRLDLQDEKGVWQLMEDFRPQMVFHLAGVNTGDPETVYRNNVLATIHLLSAVRRLCPGARVLLVGSAGEYGKVPANEMPIAESHQCRPERSYAVSKHFVALAGLDFAHSGMHVVVARPFNIVGAGIATTLLVGAFLSRIKLALAHPGVPVMRVGNLQSVRDFVSVDDVVDSYFRMLSGNNSGEIFNLCTGVPHRTGEVLDILLSLADRKIRVEVDPELLRPDEIEVCYGSPEKANRAFGFSPETDLYRILRPAWDAAMHDLRLTN